MTDPTKGTAPAIVMTITSPLPATTYRFEILCSICMRNTSDGHDHGPGQMQAILRRIPVHRT